MEKNVIQKIMAKYNIRFVHLWLFVATATIIGLSLYWKDTVIGIISAATGVICVILTADGKRSSYVWGLINCVTYAYVSYLNGLYGETMLNLIYYVPMQFVGFYLWSKNMNKTDETSGSKSENFVQVNKVGRLEMTIYIAGMTVGVIGYGIFLRYIGDALPFIDSFTTVLSVFAAIFQVRRMAEQWILWILIDIASVAMWGITMYQGSDNIGTLIMWIVYLANAVYGWVSWKKNFGIRVSKEPSTKDPDRRNCL